MTPVRASMGATDDAQAAADSEPAPTKASGKARFSPSFSIPTADKVKETLAGHYKTVKLLAEMEANDLRDTLIAALRGACETADEGISISNRRGAEATIWQTIDNEELGAIADYLLEQGKKHAAAAALVRSTVDLWKRWNIALILGPRMWDTARFYQENGVGFAAGRGQ